MVGVVRPREGQNIRARVFDIFCRHRSPVGTCHCSVRVRMGPHNNWKLTLTFFGLQLRHAKAGGGRLGSFLFEPLEIDRR
jgi:hypothetical protein